MKNTVSRRHRIVTLSVAAAAGVVVALGQAAYAGAVTLPWTFSNGTTADANQVNANFQALRDGVNANDVRIAALERTIALLRDNEWSSWAAPPDSPPASNYIVSASGETVTDGLTGLVWQRGGDGNTYTWAGAASYCASLNAAGLGGFSSGWRLPTVIELESIADYGRSSPAINGSAFPGTPAAAFWCASLLAGTASSAWVVDFLDGSSGGLAIDSSNPVRCVR